MAIPAKRFEFLNNETNLGVNDFINVTDSNIRNLETKDIEDVVDKLAEFISPINKAIEEGTDAVKDSISNALSGLDLGNFDIKDLFRETKDLIGIVGNFAKMPDKLFSGLIDSLFPDNSLAKGLAKNFFKTCNKAGAGFGNMRPFDANIDCGGNGLKGSGDCSPRGMNGLLNSLTGGKYGAAFRDINGLVNAVMAVATGSYAANFCGGFGASVGLLGNNKAAINRAGLLTMGTLAGMHHVKGSLDVLNNTDPDSIYIQNPSVIKGLVGNPRLSDNIYGNSGTTPFMNQFGTDKRSNGDILDGIMDGAALLSPEWNKNSDGGLSLSKITDGALDDVKVNKGFGSLIADKLRNNPLSLDNLNSPSDDEFDSFGSSYASLLVA